MTAQYDQLQAWLTGSPTGGPNGDGRYPLTNAQGQTFLVLCPAADSATGGTIASQPYIFAQQAKEARDQAVAAKDGIEAVQAAAATSASQSATSATAAAGSATTASNKANEAASSAGSATGSAATASNKASEAAGSASTASSKATDASNSASAASGSAGAAATSQNLAKQYANAAQNVQVEPGNYSAYHWSQVARANSGTAVLTVAGRTGDVVIGMSDIAGLQGQLDSKLGTGGTATAATKLATACTIGGVSFDGTASINLPGVNAAGTQATSGNAGSATKLATACTISLGGLLGGSASFDGSGNVTITATMADGVLSIAKTSGLQSALDGKQGVLGYNPVQQGTGVGQWGNVVKIGYNGSNTVRLTVDATDFGNLAREDWVNASYMPKSGGTFSGGITATRLTMAKDPQSGLQIDWNLAQLWWGETAFINNRGGGGGGFAWFNRNNPSAGLGPVILSLSPTGELAPADGLRLGLGGPLIHNANGIAETASSGRVTGKLTVNGGHDPAGAIDAYTGVGRVILRSSNGNNSVDSVTWDNASYAPLNFTASALTHNGNTVWSAGNFDPNTKFDKSGGAVAASGSHGYISLNGSGSQVVSGHIGFHTSDGTRQGYIGNTHDGVFEIGPESGNYVRVGGSTFEVVGALTAASVSSPSVTDTSDAKFKNNVRALRRGMDALRQLAPVEFFNKATGREDIGFIAQDVEGTFPEAVHDNGEYLSLAYQRLTAPIVVALLELDARIAALEAKV